MRIYFADTAIHLFYLYYEMGSRHFLTSFWYNYKVEPYQKLKEAHPDCTIMLDSGAFTASVRNESVDLKAYAEFCKIVSPYVDYFVNLDVIYDGETSQKNFDYLHDQGINVIPVYHAGEDIKYLQYYIKKCDYIGLGGLVPYAREPRKLENFIQNALKIIPKDKKVHLFGITTPPVLYRFSDRVYSADSVSATDIAGNQNRGFSFTGMPRGLKAIFPTTRLTPDQRDWLNRYNAMIFVKLAKQINEYAEGKVHG